MEKTLKGCEIPVFGGTQN